MKKILATAVLSLVALYQSVAHSQEQIRVFYYSLNDMYINQLSAALQDLAICSGFKLAQFDAKENIDNQNLQINKALSNGQIKTPILVNPVDNQTRLNALNKAMQNKIPIIFFNRKPNQEALNSYQDAWYVGANSAQAGFYQAQLVINALKQYKNTDINQDGYINYVILKGEPSSIETKSRSEVFIKTMLDSGIKLKPIASANANWSQHKAQNEMLNILKEKDVTLIELIVSNNDAMALGAIKALQSIGYNNPNDPNSKYIPVFGIDAIPSALDAIERGIMSGTVLNNYKSTADVMIRMSRAYIQGEEITEDLVGYPINNGVIEIPYSPIYNFNMGHSKQAQQ